MVEALLMLRNCWKMVQSRPADYRICIDNGFEQVTSLLREEYLIE